jgi:signal transduction histidine kinase
MLSAINAAPGGEVLVTAATLGSQLQIRITDDSPETDQLGREITLRQTGALIALQGGSIAVEAQKGRGTTVAIRLPVPATIEKTAGNLVQPRVLADQAA